MPACLELPFACACNPIVDLHIHATLHWLHREESGAMPGSLDRASTVE
jgi:hypothetical protein